MIPGRRAITLLVLRGKDESLATEKNPSRHVLIVTTPCDYTRMCSLLCGDAWGAGEMVPAV